MCGKAKASAQLQEVQVVQVPDAKSEDSKQSWWQSASQMITPNSDGAASEAVVDTVVDTVAPAGEKKDVDQGRQVARRWALAASKAGRMHIIYTYVWEDARMCVFLKRD